VDKDECKDKITLYHNGGREHRSVQTRDSMI